MKALQALAPLAHVNPWHWERAEILKFWEREALAYLGICVGCEWGVPGAGQGQAPGSTGAVPTRRAGLAAPGEPCTGAALTCPRWQPQVCLGPTVGHVLSMPAGRAERKTKGKGTSFPFVLNPTRSLAFPVSIGPTR